MNKKWTTSTPKLESSQLNCRGSKKNLASNLSREERLALLEWECPEHAIAVQTEMLSLNRSSLYDKPVPPSTEEVRLKHRIDEIYTNIRSWGIERSRPS